MDIKRLPHIFRFDDVCINSDMDRTNKQTDFLFEKFPDCQVMWGISPLVCDMSKEEDRPSVRERIFPQIYNALSDHRAFFNVSKAGIPEIPERVTRAAHGLVHVDHRLLTFDQQEMSILISASLANADVFIPPFNKYNTDTEIICADQDIELIRFEDGWLSMEHNRYHTGHQKWYLHGRAFNLHDFEEWFNVTV